MTKWACADDLAWRRRVGIEARRIAVQISTGHIDGPDIAAVIETLVIQASERRPERQASHDLA